MKYSELKERLKLLKVLGFEREQWSKSYRKTLSRGRYHYRRYISYDEVKLVGDFRGFLRYTLDKMDIELETYIKKEGRYETANRSVATPRFES